MNTIDNHYPKRVPEIGEVYRSYKDPFIPNSRLRVTGLEERIRTNNGLDSVCNEKCGRDGKCLHVIYRYDYDGLYERTLCTWKWESLGLIKKGEDDEHV